MSVEPGCGASRGSIMHVNAALDALCECEQSLREAGLVHAAAHAHAAAGSLRLAQRSVLHRDAADRTIVMTADGRESEELSLADGRRTGIMLTSADGLIGERSTLDAASTTMAMEMPTIACHDLGIDLLASRDAILFASNDLDAALLKSAIGLVGWVSPQRACRWATSRLGASTIVRLMRRGRPCPTLAATASGLLDLDVVRLLRSLGWRPEQRDKIGDCY